MKKIKIILGLAAFYVLFSAFWQVGACELADIELKDDMKQMATQLGMRIGVSDIGSDADLRDTILRKAAQYGITLSPDQVTVLRDGYGKNVILYFEAEYSVPIVLPGFSFAMYFNPSSGKRPKNATVTTNAS
jgi:hypothetical protein